MCLSAGGDVADPLFMLVASSTELRLLRSYWDAQRIRHHHQLIRVAASYHAEQERSAVSVAHLLTRSRSALQVLEDMAASEARGAHRARIQRLATQRALLQEQQMQQARKRSAAAAATASDTARARSEDDLRTALIERGRAQLLQQYGARFAQLDARIKVASRAVATSRTAASDTAAVAAIPKVGTTMQSVLVHQVGSLATTHPEQGASQLPVPYKLHVTQRAEPHGKNPPSTILQESSCLIVDRVAVPMPVVQLRRALEALGAPLPPCDAYERVMLEQLCRERGILPLLETTQPQMAPAEMASTDNLNNLKAKCTCVDASAQDRLLTVDARSLATNSVNTSPLMSQSASTPTLQLLTVGEEAGGKAEAAPIPWACGGPPGSLGPFPLPLRRYFATGLQMPLGSPCIEPPYQYGTNPVVFEGHGRQCAEGKCSTRTDDAIAMPADISEARRKGVRNPERGPIIVHPQPAASRSHPSCAYSAVPTLSARSVVMLNASLPGDAAANASTVAETVKAHLAPIDVVIDACIISPLRATQSWLGRAALLVLLHEHRLLELLEAMREYLLGGCADFRVALVTGLVDELKRGPIRGSHAASASHTAPCGDKDDSDQSRLRRVLDVALRLSGVDDASQRKMRFAARLTLTTAMPTREIRAQSSSIINFKSGGAEVNSPILAAGVTAAATAAVMATATNESPWELVHHIDAFDGISLELPVPPPLDKLLTPQSMYAYRAIHRLLLKTERACDALSALWMRLRKPSPNERGNADNVEPQFSGAHAWHALRLHVHELRHFASLVQQHILAGVCEGCWAELLRSIAAATSPSHVRRAHANFGEAAVAHCLLHADGAAASALITSVLSLSLKLHRELLGAEHSDDLMMSTSIDDERTVARECGFLPTLVRTSRRRFALLIASLAEHPLAPASLVQPNVFLMQGENKLGRTDIRGPMI